MSPDPTVHPTVHPTAHPIVTTSGAEARHRIANLLHGYTRIADRKDVAAVLDLLGGAVVRFPDDGYDHRDDAEGFFRRLWRDDTAHRHEVTNLVVEPVAPGSWLATALYSRLLLTPVPVLATLGEYSLLVQEDGGDRGAWAVVSLTVTRTWSR